MTVLVSYDGTCCVGFTLDAAAVTDVPLFERCARQGFDEVLALAGGACVVPHQPATVRRPPAAP
jgi:diacylglycerol O-acyltransferase